MRVIFWVCFQALTNSILGVLLICTALADEEADLEDKLDTVQQNLTAIEQSQSAIRADQALQQTAIQTLDTDIAATLKRLRAAETQAIAAKTQISMLKDHRLELEARKTEKAERVKEHLRAASRLGDRGLLRVLLNQEDPNQMARLSQNYKYLSEAKLREINAFEVILLDLSNNEQALNREIEIAKNAARSISESQDDLKRQRIALAQQAQILKEAFDSTESQRRVLEEDKNNLLALLDRLRRNSFGLPQSVDFATMASRKGSLDLPTSGVIRHRFGEKRLDGRIRWDGLFIDAASGEKVSAVHYGRVVFADWLRGFGLLIILRHSDGFMSLYGHNQVIFPEVGDWVVGGQTIAEVGRSGGQAMSGSYFEIRDQGNPVDPLAWCKPVTRQSRTL